MVVRFQLFETGICQVLWSLQSKQERKGWLSQAALVRKSVIEAISFHNSTQIVALKWSTTCKKKRLFLLWNEYL
jgi:hypothetical protein